MLTPRSILLRGLLAGLLAGLATFVVGSAVGEPPLSSAIGIEQSPDHLDATPDHAPDHAEAGPVSRTVQRTWGLALASLVAGTALGGLVALAAAVALGRLGPLDPLRSTAVVATVGYLSVALVPFWKYPATPPGAAAADTIGPRTADYGAFLLVSVLAAAGAVLLAVRAARRTDAAVAVGLAVATYLAVVVLAGVLLPASEPTGAFPADVLWEFRRASLTTLTTLWLVLGTALTLGVARLARGEDAVQARRALAASL